ncbi:MAG: hypothetical protein CMM50_13410 [Rhodospirillaceae bacterium]|nr:hypothetical protein [Rhodospirillaceae bacterium]
MQAAASTMGILEIVVLILIGGALGGAAEFLRRFSFADGRLVLLYGSVDGSEAERIEKRVGFGSAALLLLFAMTIGFAGALGVQFVLVTLDAVKILDTPEHKLFLLSISAAAGFGARQLLIKLSHKLEEQIRAAEEKAVAAGRKAESAAALATTTSRESVYDAQFVNSVESVIRGEAGPATTEHVLHRLREITAEDPLRGAFAIPLSFLLRNRGRLPEALDVIERFLRAKEAVGETDEKYGSALYNKACFLALRFAQSGNDADRKAALETLERSLKVNDDNWTYALVDDDLASLREDQAFKALAGSAPDWARKQ